MPSVERLPEEEDATIAALRDRLKRRDDGKKHISAALSCSVKPWAYPVLKAVGITPQFSEAAVLRMVDGILWHEMQQEGEMAEIQTIYPSGIIGTIDIWKNGRFVVELKSTDMSSLKPLSESWLTQLGAYIAPNIRPGVAQASGLLKIRYKRGDNYMLSCPDHGLPNENVTRKNDKTGRQKKVCPDCLQNDGWERFLESGDGKATLRTYRVTYSREELDKIMAMVDLRHDLLDEQAANPEYVIGNPPPVIFAAGDFECVDCEVRELISCPTMSGKADEEAQLSDSLASEGKTIEELQKEILAV